MADEKKKKDSLGTLVEIKCREDIINLPDIATLRDLKSQWNIESDSPLQTREDYIRLLLRVYDQSHERIQKVRIVTQSAVTIIPNIILSRVWCPLHWQQFVFCKKKKSTKWFFLLILINLHIIHGVSKLLIRMLLVNYALITIFFTDICLSNMLQHLFSRFREPLYLLFCYQLYQSRSLFVFQIFKSLVKSVQMPIVLNVLMIQLFKAIHYYVPATVLKLTYTCVRKIFVLLKTI